MGYKDITLIVLGMLGVMLHSLVKIRQLKKQDKNATFSIWQYFDAEWPTMLISICVIVVAFICKKEVAKLDDAGDKLGLGFFALGYMGQSILIAFMSKAADKFGIKSEDDKPGE